MPKTVLLADDSVTIQKVVGISFANEDVVLLTVDNGDDAIARAREARPDVVLADVVMPGKNGYEVCEAIKSDPELRHVPVLLLTGTFEAFDEERARRAGADGHITKPFEAQALVDRVHELLERGSRAAATAPPPAASPQPASPSRSEEPHRVGEAVFDFFDEEEAPATAEPAAVASADAEEPFELESFLDESEGPGGSEAEEATVWSPEAGAEIGEAPTAVEAPQPAGPASAGDEDRTVLAAAPTAPTQPDPEPLEAATGAPDAGPGEALPSAAPAAAAETQLIDESAFGIEQPGMDAAAGDPLDLGQLEEEPFDFSAELEPAGPQAVTGEDAGTSPGAEAEIEPVAPELAPEEPPELGPEEIARQAALDPELGAGHEVGPLDLGEPATPPPPSGAADARAVSEAEAASPPAEPEGARQASRSLPPELRHEIRDSLEKMAWEAFGDLSERLVRHALERIEAIAWEVIPQMAETLIREELRRLREESDSD